MHGKERQYKAKVNNYFRQMFDQINNELNPEAEKVNLKMEYINEVLGKDASTAFKPITMQDIIGDSPLLPPNPSDFGL